MKKNLLTIILITIILFTAFAVPVTAFADVTVWEKDEIDSLEKPTDIVVTDKGYFITEAKNNRIMLYNPTTKELKPFAFTKNEKNQPTKNPSSKIGEFNNPTSLDIDEKGRIFVADTNNDRIQMYDNGIWEVLTPDVSNVEKPTDVYYSNGTLYVSSTNNYCEYNLDTKTWVVHNSMPANYVCRLNNTTYLVKTNAETSNGSSIKSLTDNQYKDFATFGIKVGHVDKPKGICVDSDKNIYVLDSANNRIQKFDGNKWTSVYQSKDLAGCTGITIDKNNNIYICDTANNKIIKRRFTSNNSVVTTLNIKEDYYITNDKINVDVDFDVDQLYLNFECTNNGDAVLFKDKKLNQKISKLDLITGVNTYYLKVTAENDINYKIYELNIKRGLDKNIIVSKNQLSKINDNFYIYKYNKLFSNEFDLSNIIISNSNIEFYADKDCTQQLNNKLKLDKVNKVFFIKIIGKDNKTFEVYPIQISRDNYEIRIILGIVFALLILVVGYLVIRVLKLRKVSNKLETAVENKSINNHKDIKSKNLDADLAGLSFDNKKIASKPLATSITFDEEDDDIQINSTTFSSIVREFEDTEDIAINTNILQNKSTTIDTKSIVDNLEEDEFSEMPSFEKIIDRMRSIGLDDKELWLKNKKVKARLMDCIPSQYDYIINISNIILTRNEMVPLIDRQSITEIEINRIISKINKSYGIKSAYIKYVVTLILKLFEIEISVF